jgi:hypothetical protein
MAVLIAVPSTVTAQSTTDTVYIPGSSSLQISNIINADTSVTAHRVYKLDRGAIYYMDKAFEITHPCTFIATGDATKRPPVIAPAIRADGSAEEWFFKLIKPGIKVELYDLYLLSMRSDKKTLGWSRGIYVGANNVSLKMRRVVMDAFTEAGIRVEGADFYKLDVQDCHFRNFIHSTSYFGGQPFLSNGQDHPDTTKFINNTFFACNAYIWAIRGAGPLNVFEHNTIAYQVVNPFYTFIADNIYLKNNLIYGAHAWGGDPEQVNGSWLANYPDTISSSIFQIRKKMDYNGYPVSGPEILYENLGLTFDPSKRVNVAQNNAYYWPQKLVKYYNDWNDTVTVADSVELLSGTKKYMVRKLSKPTWISKYAATVIDSLTNPSSWDYSPYVSVANNMEADPGFTDAGVVNHVDSLIGYVNRIASRTLDNPWHYELNFPPKWPLPENLAYSNTTLQSAGTDGFAVGDLNWFPAQKQQWILTDVKSDVSVIPSEFKLEQNYPNPFNPTTTIKFSVPKAGNYSLRVFNVLGQEVAKLHNGQLNAGSHEATFNASKLGSGVYFYNLSGNEVNITKKMMLIK